MLLAAVSAAYLLGSLSAPQADRSVGLFLAQGSAFA
jgi:hypothetical protein